MGSQSRRRDRGDKCSNPIGHPKNAKKSTSLRRHSEVSPSGGVQAMIPSLFGLAVLVFAWMAQQGFRGRASVAGIDLGTTNSVVCVQAPSKSVGEITCIEDPRSGSAIIPSVVSFLEPHERNVGQSSKRKSSISPHPSRVVVGAEAKQRIDSHPHQTIYHAKRVLGRPSSDPAVAELKHEVEYSIEDDDSSEVSFQVNGIRLFPHQVGSYIVHHLMQITNDFLGHDNVKSAVLAVPAKFDEFQRQRTADAFSNAGIKIARILEEPTAAALAYGLHQKDGVEKILVYDFGGGTLDVSILHVSEGYCEVIGSDGDDRLGGADFDASVAAVLATRHQETLARIVHEKVDIELLSASCPKVTEQIPICSLSSFHTLGEKLKISLAENGNTADAKCWKVEDRASQATNEKREQICDMLSLQALSLTLHDFDEAVKHLLDRSTLPVTRLLGDLALQPDDIDEIVMVGGTTRMPQIRDLVSGAFSEAQLNTHIDPDITVAYGAASVND